MVAGLLAFGLLKGREEPAENGTAAPAENGSEGGAAGASSVAEASANAGEPEVAFIPAGELKVAGHATPEKALRSFFASQRAIDFKGMAAALTPEDAKEFLNFMSVPALSGDIVQGLTNAPICRLSGFRIVGRESVSEEEEKITVRFGSAEEDTAGDRAIVYTLKQIAGDWKIDDNRPANEEK